MICNEIFGEENFVANFLVNSAPAGTQSSNNVSVQHSYCLCYSKNISKINFISKRTKKELEDRYKESDINGKFYSERLWKRGIGGRKEDVPSLHFPVYFSPDKNKIFIDCEYNQEDGFIKILPYQTKGVLGRWTWSKNKMIKEKSKLIFKLVSSEWKLHKKVYQSSEKGKLPFSIINSDIARTELGSIELKSIFENKKYFEYPKSSFFIKRFLEFSTNKNDLILDFFAGSGTTGQAVLELNKEDGGDRKFILVQLPELTNPKSEAYKNGYKYISDITKQRIRRVVRGYGKNPTPINSGFKVFKLDRSNYKINEKINYLYSLDEKQKDNQKYENSQKLKDKIKTSFDFEDKFINGWKKEDVIYENIIKEGYNLNSTIKELTNCQPYKIYKISDSVKEKSFYITFDEIDIDITLQDEFKDIANDTLFICLDSNLKDNVKLNLKYSFILKTL